MQFKKTPTGPMSTRKTTIIFNIIHCYTSFVLFSDDPLQRFPLRPVSQNIMKSSDDKRFCETCTNGIKGYLQKEHEVLCIYSIEHWCASIGVNTVEGQCPQMRSMTLQLQKTQKLSQHTTCKSCLMNSLNSDRYATNKDDWRKKTWYTTFYKLFKTRFGCSAKMEPLPSHHPRLFQKQ